MKQGDYKIRKRTGKRGKTVKEKVVTSTTGVEYVVGKSIYCGNTATLYKARRLSDKKACVFKAYDHLSESDEVLRAIKRNISGQMKRPFTEKDGKTVLKSLVGPMDRHSMIELRESRSFGYVMESVDTAEYISVPKLWHKDRYPDAKTICRMIFNIADSFERIHRRNWSYKDLSERNMFVDPKTGDVRVIDCDNIGPAANKTVFGTVSYIAPEVYVTETPDTYSDYYAMAVLFYRILIGGYPLDGKRTMDYLLANKLNVEEAADRIYGQQALFAFDPKDTSNTIRGLTDPAAPELYRIQTERWDKLPGEFRELFIRTFSDGLRSKNLRATDRDWKNAAKRVAAEGLATCANCGRTVFAAESGDTECIFCGSRIAAGRSLRIRSNRRGRVWFSVRDAKGSEEQLLEARDGSTMQSTPHPSLREDWMRVQRHDAGSFAAINQSGADWIISMSGKKAVCPPGKGVMLKKSMEIDPAVCSECMTVAYNKENGLYGAVNRSGKDWIVTYSGKSYVCHTGQRVILTDGVKIETALTGSILHIAGGTGGKALCAVNRSGNDWITSVKGSKKICTPGSRITLEKGMTISPVRRELWLSVKRVV